MDVMDKRSLRYIQCCSCGATGPKMCDEACAADEWDDALRWPESARGVWIQPGDVVYDTGGEAMTVTCIKASVAGVSIETSKDGCTGYALYLDPAELSHRAPDTWESVEADLREMAKLEPSDPGYSIDRIIKRMRKLAGRDAEGAEG